MGMLTLQKLPMMERPKVTEGVWNVYLDQDRAFGFGCNSLSPASIGPIAHGQPGLPDARILENFHEGSKCFAEELDENGNPGPLYYENRRHFYLAPEPRGHKYKNVPQFFVWTDRGGKEYHLTCIESRQFYCTFYERIAKETDDFKHLCDLLRLGTNLEICGYDGNPLKDGQTLDEAYEDDSVSFGHERVLYTMLLFRTQGRPECDYPWRKNTMFDF